MPNLDSRFSVAPSFANIQSSTLDMPYRKLTTGNFGDIIPFYAQEIMPGDQFDISTRCLARMATPLHPVMDDAWIDTYFFFVPNRLVWSHWAEFLGENKYSAWSQPVDYVVPHAEVIPALGSVYDHIGIPTYSDGYGVTADINFLLPRAYHLIYNEWFRNENTTDPILVNTGDDVDIEEVERFQTLCKAAKPFDYFTACLPSPQKGNAVDIPLTGDAIVKTSNTNIFTNPYPMSFSVTDVNLASGTSQYTLFAETNGSYPTEAVLYGATLNPDVNEDPAIKIGGPNNLYADLSSVTGATINQLRQAFQMQKLLELQARSGSRYTEIIRSSFGVVSPDARLQRPEFLGGNKFMVSMQQVTQTTPATRTTGGVASSPLGHEGAYSKTINANHDFSKAFTEHGFIVGVAVARHRLTYCQGINKMHTRTDRYSYYWPTFAHIGEQPVLNKEIYLTGTESDNQVFGYNEAWAEYRYKPNEVSGYFRPTITDGLDEWHYAEYYEELPVLSSEWMDASAVNVDRTLAVTSSVHHQMLFDFALDIKATRPMPLYSVPGLIDHF